MPKHNPAPEGRQDNPLTELYMLTYIHANVTKSKLLRFSINKSDPDIVTDLKPLADYFCKRNNYRFLYLEPAITIIEEGEPIG